MGRKANFSKELKLKIVKKYLNGESASSLANEYGMSQFGSSMVFEWVHKYEALGETALDNSSTNKSYSKELKELVIKEYLSGGISFLDLAIKYNISSREIVRQWVLKYNNGIVTRDYNPKSEVYTMKARKTTIEERIEIVNYVLSNDNNYKEAADRYSEVIQ